MIDHEDIIRLNLLFAMEKYVRVVFCTRFFYVSSLETEAVRKENFLADDVGHSSYCFIISRPFKGLQIPRHLGRALRFC